MAAKLNSIGIGGSAPEWGLLGLIGISPLIRSFNSQLLSPETILHFKTAAAFCLGAVWTVRQILLKRESRFPRWLLAFFAVWMGWTILVTSYATQPSDSLCYLLLVGSGVVMFCITWHMEEKWHRRLVLGMLVMGGGVACLGVLQYAITNFNLFLSLARYVLPPRLQMHHQIYSMMEASTFVERSAATMTHPNMLGIYLAMLIPFACALITVKSLPTKVRYFAIGIFGLLLAGLYTTNSRGAMIFAFVALMILAVHKEHRWLMVFGGSVVALALIYWGLSANHPGILQWFSTQTRVETGLSGRGEVWKNALNMASSSPWLGVGPGNFHYEYVSRYGFFIPDLLKGEQFEQIWFLQTAGEEFILRFHAHNLYLHLLGELGVGGLLLFAIGEVLIYLQYKKAVAHHREYSLRRALAVALFSIAGATIVYGCFESQAPLIRSGLNLLIAPLLAVGLSACRTERLAFRP